MKTKAAFIIGAGVGYLLGTRSGRKEMEKIQEWTRGVWADPRVQSQVSDLESTATEFARTKGAAIKEKVVETVGKAKASASSNHTA